MPTKAEIEDKVLDEIARIANVARKKIKKTHVLTDPPLSMDSNDLADLALALREYVKEHDPSATVTVGDVNTPNLTVGQLIDKIDKILNP